MYLNSNGFKNQENDFYIPVEKLDSRWDITAKLSYITVYIFLHYKKKILIYLEYTGVFFERNMKRE